MVLESIKESIQRLYEAVEVAARSVIEVIPEPENHEGEPPLKHVHPSAEFGPAALYILDWSHGNVYDFCANMSKPRYQEQVREVVVNGSGHIVGMIENLKSAFASSKIVKVRVAWEDEELFRNSRSHAERVGMIVTHRVLEGFYGKDCPVRQLVLERVCWRLFTEKNYETVIPAFQRLELLTLHFQPSEHDGKRDFQDSLGYVLRLCRNLRVLRLHFSPSPFRPSESYSREEVWTPPDFGRMAGIVVFNKLEELTLENAALDPEFAIKFFRIHAKTLNKVQLNSLYDFSATMREDPRFTRSLVKAKLEDIRLRGTWYRLIPTSEINHYTPEIVWDDSRAADLQAMRITEQRILRGGKNPWARASSVQLDLDANSPWQKFKQCCIEFVSEKICRKKIDTGE